MQDTMLDLRERVNKAFQFAVEFVKNPLYHLAIKHNLLEHRGLLEKIKAKSVEEVDIVREHVLDALESIKGLIND